MQTWISLHQNKLTFPHRQVRMSIINQVKISQWVKSLFEESIIKYFSKHFVCCTHSRQWASSRCMHLHRKSVCASLFSDYYKVAWHLELVHHILQLTIKLWKIIFELIDLVVRSLISKLYKIWSSDCPNLMYDDEKINFFDDWHP